MAHPKMFDDDDPFLGRVREIAATLPGSAEKVSHGRPALYTTKVFAYYGASVKVDGEFMLHLGPSGWIAVDLDDDTDWSEVAELLDASYRLTAPKKLIAELDAAG